MADPITDVSLEVPEGTEKIPGTFDTTEKQQAAFSDIQPVGELGTPGSFLVGKKRSIALPDGNVTADASGQIEPGGTPLESGPLGVTDATDIAKTSAVGTTTDSITEFLKQNKADNEALQEQILQANLPTEREKELEKRLDEVSASRDLGLVDAEGKAIALDFITGQQAQIERRAAALAQPIEQELDRLFRSRSNNLASLTQRLGFQGANQALQFQIAQEMQKPAREAELATRNFVLGMASNFPDAGITIDDSVAEAQEKVKKSEIFQQQVNAQEPTTGDITEFNFAKEQGFTGSFLDFLGQRASRQRASTGSNGPVPQFNLPTAPTQTFEEFIAEKENVIGQSFSGAERARLRTEYDAQQEETSKAQQFALAQQWAAGASVQDLQNQRGLADDFEKEAKPFKEQTSAYNRVIASATDPSAAGDLALIFNFMKVLDPGSVVREGEFANAQNAGSIPQRTQATYNKVLRGERLSEEQRADFLSRSTGLYNSATKQHESLVEDFTNRALIFNVPTELVVRDVASVNQPLATGVTQSGIQYTIVE